MPEKATVSRRGAMKAIALGTTGLAGCLGGVGGGSSGDNEHWPPAQGLIDITTPAGPGSSRYAIPNTWANYLEYPDDVDISLSSVTGGGGLVQLNQTFQEDPESGVLLFQTLGNSFLNEITGDDVEFTVEEFRQFALVGQATFAIFVNPRNTGIDDHFQLDYDTFVEQLPEWNIGASSVLGRFPYLWIAENDPNLSPDDLNIIGYDGGSETRAAHERGDVHTSSHTASANYQTRSDFYKCQFVMGLPDDGELHQKIENNMENPAFLADTDFPADAAEFLGAFLSDGYYFALPPGAPDELVDIHEETFKAADGPELKVDIEETMGEGEHIPALDADAVDELIDNRAQTLTAQGDKLRALLS